ncbi:MAG: redox-sensing transcriptional repressor Rex [Ruminococcaceae bacterium]|nr:redox-sensing transcriptional repressor Rex [Oscillospiraceae bacterium]
MESIDKVKGTFERRVTATDKGQVSVAVIRRLPRYHRYLGDLLRAGRFRISSAELSKLMGVTASQIRQDFNCFGGFGQQGYGYNVKYLHAKIGELLGMSEGYRAVIVGVGNLGKALASTHMFERRGVTVVALFDKDPRIVGTEYNGYKVHNVSELGDFCRRENIHIGVLTVPKESADECASVMGDAGVRGIWNFANMELSAPNPGVVVQNVHMGDSLMTLCFGMKAGGEKGIFDDQV